MKIEVIEPVGRKVYFSIFGNVLEALKACKLTGKVVMVKDMKTILKYGVTSASALVINGIVVFSGESLSSDEIIKLIQRHL